MDGDKDGNGARGRDIAGCSWVGTEKEKRMEMEMEMERGRDAYSWVFLGWHGAGNRMTFDDPAQT